MRQSAVISIVILAVLLQVSLLPAMRPFGVIPDLVLAVVAAIALGGPIVQAMGIGIGAGIFLDTVSGSDFGLRTGLLAVAVIISAFARRSGLQVGIRFQLLTLIVIVCTLSAGVSIAEIILSGGRVHIPTFVSLWIGVVVTTSALGLLIGPWCARLAKPSGYGDAE